MSSVGGAVRAAGGRALAVGRHRIPVVLPRWGDPRLKVAAVLLTVQALGQTVLGFKLSIAQILITIGTAAVIETGVTFWRDRALVWPASALLTGNSVALLLRTTGTEHGDWWSLNGAEWFVAAAVVSLLSKYLVRPAGRHVFNPSNLGLVAVLLVAGAEQVFPQYLWWGPVGAPVLATVAVLVGGAVWVLRPLGMLPMVGAFTIPFTAAAAALALTGQEFFAIWATEPVSGWSYWSTVVLSPETMIFVFFMMSDPQTAPRGPGGRVLFGAVTAVLAIVLLAPQSTEFGIKLAILSSLTLSCALTPVIERLTLPASAPLRLRPRRWRWATAAVAVVALAAAADTAALSGDQHLVLIERGLVKGPGAQ